MKYETLARRTYSPYPFAPEVKDSVAVVVFGGWLKLIALEWKCGLCRCPIKNVRLFVGLCTGETNDRKEDEPNH